MPSLKQIKTCLKHQEELLTKTRFISDNTILMLHTINQINILKQLSVMLNCFDEPLIRQYSSVCETQKNLINTCLMNNKTMFMNQTGNVFFEKRIEDLSFNVSELDLVAQHPGIQNNNSPISQNIDFEKQRVVTNPKNNSNLMFPVEPKTVPSNDDTLKYINFNNN